ncbi:hypothetical protein A3860_20220 [Niastella vici]|uniref:Uncharacterized protein n=1 Tax=Niastella vici TaxID=1703345 RepID=A0A1V9G101_9BACT|nr:hypothetical protein A3860_20220 [Niastella vici]
MLSIILHAAGEVNAGFCRLVWCNSKTAYPVLAGLLVIAGISGNVAGKKWQPVLLRNGKNFS